MDKAGRLTPAGNYLLYARVWYAPSRLKYDPVGTTTFGVLFKLVLEVLWIWINAKEVFFRAIRKLSVGSFEPQA